MLVSLALCLVTLHPAAKAQVPGLANCHQNAFLIPSRGRSHETCVWMVNFQ
jgi:hypothetical protein